MVVYFENMAGESYISYSTLTSFGIYRLEGCEEEEFLENSVC